MRRLHRDEDGFALVTAMAIMAVLALLVVVALSAGNAAFQNAERGARWTRTLGIAEAGVNDAVTLIAQDRDATSPCVIGTSGVCPTTDGEYQWSRETDSGGNVVITAVGYYPSVATAQITRKIRVTLQPQVQFEYALFSSSTLEVKNNQIVVGDIFANSQVTLGANAVICGSVINAQGGVGTGNGTQIVKSYGSNCSGKEGRAWAGGTIALMPTGVIQGDAIAGAPSSVSCPPTPNTQYAITGGTVQGAATACGVVTATTPSASAGVRVDPPATRSLPAFTFDPENYESMTCFAQDSFGCSDDASNRSTTAVSQFNGSVSKSNMSGTYVIWQSQPSQSTVVNLENLSLAGDLTIITNAPITLGNTSKVTTTKPAVLVLISLYQPPTGTTCSEAGGDCSIYGKNSVVFDSGSASDPNDGIAALLYTPGKMAFKNQTNGADGALYAGSMDIKNGFDIVYNSRIERVLGFGVGMEVTLWQELAD